MAGLLHDVGHACFSHAAESVIHSGKGHEALTIELVEQKEYLGGELEKVFFVGFAALLGKVIRGGAGMPPQLKVLKDLVSGEMDADRSDYLLRDSLHCGVEYGKFDYLRMLQCLDLHEVGAGALEIALNRDGLHTFEALILARYQMNTQVYFHRIRRIFDYYLCKYFELKGRQCFDTTPKILGLTDISAMTMIFDDARSGKGEHGKWAARIRDRNHHRVVHETGEDANAMDLRHSVTLLDKLQGEFPGVEFIPDRASSSVHKLLLPEDQEQEANLVALPLIESSGEAHYLGERSHILKRIPRRFQVARIFADIPRDDKDRLRTIRTFALNEYRRLGGRS